MSFSKKIASKLYTIEYVKKAVQEKADLGELKAKPTLRIWFGIFLMGFSYILGWPCVGMFGVLAIMWKEPLIAVIGGPAIYGISHLVFLAGFYLAGARYSVIILRWATRMAIEKALCFDNDPSRSKTETNSY